jgi:hypothetical protein
MKNIFRIIIFLGVLYLSIFSICTLLEYTYNNFNIWLTLVINIVSMMILIYFIDKFVDKLDKHD